MSSATGTAVSPRVTACWPGRSICSPRPLDATRTSPSITDTRDPLTPWPTAKMVPTTATRQSSVAT